MVERTDAELSELWNAIARKGGEEGNVTSRIRALYEQGLADALGFVPRNHIARHAKPDDERQRFLDDAATIFQGRAFIDRGNLVTPKASAEDAYDWAEALWEERERRSKAGT